jgi:hypothetical protein
MFSYINNYPNDRENGWSDELQGVTNDGVNWYFSQKDTLWKFPVSHNLNAKITSANPQKGILKVPLNLQGYDHFGDLDYYEGKLFVPVEGRPYAIIALYNASDLSFIGAGWINAKNAPWCAVNPRDGLIYTSVFDNVDYLSAFHYEIMDNGDLILTLVKKFYLYNENGSLLSLGRVQGGVFSKQSNYLYLVSDAHNSSNGIYVIDSETGKKSDKINVDYKPTMAGYTAEELEGITIWDLDNNLSPNISGQLHLVMIDNVGTGADDLYFKHYKADIEKAGAAIPQKSSLPTLVFNYLGNYPRDRENGWSDEIQGVTHDNDNWFFTQTKTLWKFPVSHDLHKKVTKSDLSKGIIKKGIPQSLSSAGYNHYGDFSHYGGFLFIPLTGSSEPCIAVFNAADLSYITHTKMSMFAGLGWCAVNPNDGCLYTTDRNLGSRFEYKFSPLIGFSIDMDKLRNQHILTLVQVKTVVLKTQEGNPVVLKHMQGGTFDNSNNLYIMNGYCEDFNEKDGGISVFDLAAGIRVARSSSGSGSFNYEFHPGWAKYEEPEGLTYWDLNDGRSPNIRGVLHALMLDNDTNDDDLYFKHYDKINTGSDNTLIDIDKLYVANMNPRSREVHSISCSWADNISLENRMYYGSLQKALYDGFDGCYHCLKRYHRR